ncbi:MAG: hypothetical protein F6K11_16560 [Leptolyngbya sp. SIO3F4]|nr:hypothetical protein [Leptolyngbya sp. SIO3F4]
MAQIDGVLVGISVVILVGSAILRLQTGKSALTRSHLVTQQQQKAWQWWYHQQQQKQYYQAEIVRDGLLQEAFALRRHLEQENQDVPASYLDQFNQFYQTLENLSNQLSPPFVDDSLPLALQFLIKQYTNVDGPFEIAADTDWSTESTENNHVVISVVHELLPLLQEDIRSSFNVRLWQDNSVNKLQLTGSLSKQQITASILSKTEVVYLKGIFHSLISGTLELKQDNTELICQLSWHRAILT